MDLASPNLIRPRRRGRTSSLLGTFWNQLGSDSLSFSSLSTRCLPDHHSPSPSSCPYGSSMTSSPGVSSLGLPRPRMLDRRDDIPISPKTLRSSRTHRRKAAPPPLDLQLKDQTHEQDIDRSLPSSATIPCGQRIKARQATPFVSAMGIETLLGFYDYSIDNNISGTTFVDFDFGLALPLVELGDGYFTFGDDSLIQTPRPSPRRQTCLGFEASTDNKSARAKPSRIALANTTPAHTAGLSINARRPRIAS